MLEPAVIGSWVNKAGQSQLLYISQPLKPGVLDDVEDQISGYVDKTIDRIVYNFSLVYSVRHLEISCLQK